MGYSRKIVKEKDFIKVMIKGTSIPGFEAEDAISVLKDITTHCEMFNMNKILAYWDIKGRLPSHSAYVIIKSYEEFNWKREYRLAAIHTDVDRYNDNKFAEYVAEREGFVYKAFNNEIDAKEWLHP